MAPRATLAPLLLILLPSVLFQLAIAQSSASAKPSCPTQTTNGGPSAAQTSESVFSVIASCTPGDGSYKLQPGSVGADPTSVQGENDAGASGSGNSFVNLSNTDLTVIIVVSVVVGVLGIASALLYYFAKKRQWELREKLRRSARSVKAALTPRATQTHFNRKDRGVRRVADDSPSTSPPPRSAMKKPTIKTNMNQVQNATDERRGRDGRGGRDAALHDLEKGMGSKTTVTGISSFDMDSDSPKTWKQKFFGGRSR